MRRKIKTAGYGSGYTNCFKNIVSGKERIKMKNRQRLGKTTVAIVVSTLAFSNCAWGLPQGGTVVTGNGSYASSGNQMDITGTGNVSVKWDSFNVAAGETVNFKNMNAILNYVTGRQGSEIFGALNGQGVHVFLINPNGILFGKTAQVNVGSLTASTKSLSDVDAALQNFKNSAGISDFGIAGTAELVNMGKLEADTLRFEGSRIVLDTDNIKLGGDDFDGSNAVINGDFANGNVVLGYTAHDANGYAGKDKNFDINGGAQSVKGYMWVTNAEQLQDINTNLSGNYALKNDIDAGSSSQKSFTQIGSGQNMFYGHLDGLGYSIKDLTINKNANFMGLFYQTSKSAKIRNLVLDNIKVSGYSANGTVAGANQGLIENIIVTGIVSGAKGINGGIVGINAGIIRNVIVDIDVDGGGTALGGIAGQNQAAGSIDSVIVRGKVGNSIFDVMGGIVGDNSGQLNNVRNEAIVVGHNAVAGIVGQDKASYTISNAVNTGNITGADYVGGIVGYYSNDNDMLLENSNNSGNITGNSMVGGIVGSGGGAVIGGGGRIGCVSIENSENSGDIKGSNSVGGIMGGSGYTKLIDKVINYGTVTGMSQVGGILGNTASGKIEEALNLGQIIGTADGAIVGGIVGVGYDAIVSDKAVYATTDKDGNTYDISKYNDKGVGKAYADIFPAPPLPPDPPELPEDEHDITKLPEFEDNYHSSSSAVTSELHTPVIINPSGENTNIGVGTIEIHNSDDSLNASGSGSSFSAGFENILAGAGQEEQADSNSRSSDTGDVQGSQMDNLAGGNDTDLSMSSDSETEDQDE